MSFQSLGKKSHDDSRHLEKKITNTFRSQTLPISRLSAHEIMTYVSSFAHYIYNIRSIGKIRTTEESLNARLSNDVKFDSNILKNIAMP